MYIVTVIIRFVISMLKTVLTKVTGFESTKMVIIIRTDLKMGRGKIASQAAHAAVLLYQSSIETSNPHLKWWLHTGQPKIVLKIDTNCDEDLTNIYQKAKDLNLNTCMVKDAGRTQIDTGTLTAVGIGPNRKEDVEKLTSNFKLL